MKKFILPLFFLIFFNLSHAGYRIGFGSCNEQDKDVGQYDQMNFANLDMWLWLGDNIYADHFLPSERRDAYKKIYNHPSYKNMRKVIPIYGTWDDHDYGYDNVGAEYHFKEETKLEFLKFLDFQERDPIRTREGIYYQRVIKHQDLAIQLIFLDVRSFKTRKSLLGDKQWRWLERALRKNPYDLTIISSGLNILTDHFPIFYYIEGWYKYEKERENLLKFVSDLDRPVIFLSGDRHFSERSRMFIKNKKVVYEFMSSGITKVKNIYSCNKYRIGKAVKSRNFSTLEIQKDPSLGKLKLEHEILSSETGELLSGYSLIL